MEQGRVELRRGRRADVQAPLMIQRSAGGGQEAVKEEITKNISLAGIYFETEMEGAYAVNDSLMTSVSIPVPQTRAFPFTRLAGHCRVVRVSELPEAKPTGRKRFGVALEFGEDLTALTALPR